MLFNLYLSLFFSSPLSLSFSLSIHFSLLSIPVLYLYCISISIIFLTFFILPFSLFSMSSVSFIIPLLLPLSFFFSLFLFLSLSQPSSFGPPSFFGNSQPRVHSSSAFFTSSISSFAITLSHMLCCLSFCTSGASTLLSQSLFLFIFSFLSLCLFLLHLFFSRSLSLILPLSIVVSFPRSSSHPLYLFDILTFSLRSLTLSLTVTAAQHRL